MRIMETGNTHTTNQNGAGSVHWEAPGSGGCPNPLVIVCVRFAGIGTFRTTTRQTLFQAGSHHTYCKADGSLNSGRQEAMCRLMKISKLAPGGGQWVEDSRPFK